MQHPKSNISFPLISSPPQRCSFRRRVKQHRSAGQTGESGPELRAGRLSNNDQQGQRTLEKPSTDLDAEPETLQNQNRRPSHSFWTVNTKRDDIIEAKNPTFSEDVSTLGAPLQHCSGLIQNSFKNQTRSTNGSIRARNNHPMCLDQTKILT